MITSASTTRRNVEMQGFVGLDDATVSEINPWLRLAPAICMTWAAIATFAQSPAGFYTLVPFAVLGVVMRNHPFDALYNHAFRHFLGHDRLPRYGAPRRFACAVASVWLAAAGSAFAAGFSALGIALGCAMVLVAAVPAVTGFCIPSYLYGLIFNRPATA